MTERVCLDCPKLIKGWTAKRCRPCANRVPRGAEHSARIGAALRARFAADPEAKAAQVRASQERLAAWRATPEGRAKFDQHWMTARKVGVERSAEKRRGWCPPEYRALDDQYRRRGYRTDKRKALIAERQATDIAAAAEAERQRLAGMTHLERQLERVRNGARVVDRVPMPSRQYAYSLTGGSL